MATDNLQAGSAPANDLPHELGRQPHETSQQHADRLLEARRHGVDMAGDGAPTINRDALDRLDLGNQQLSYIDALTHAIMDTVEDAHALVHGSGGIQIDALGHFTGRAITLLCLLMDQNKLAADSVYAAILGWLLVGRTISAPNVLDDYSGAFFSGNVAR